ncbi:WYL domain-containing protein [Clostridium sp. DL1XJH146]
MEIFSEIYGCYYNVVTKILNKAYDKQITKEDMNRIINEQAFCESALYIMPKLISGEWNLLENKDEKFSSKLKSKIKLPVTTLEKSWIKALLLDKRIKLFLKEEQIAYLDKYLEDIELLFKVDDFYCFDSYEDGDDYRDKDYIDNFQWILSALKNKETIKITFISGKGNRIEGNYLPCKLQYSSKDDKFRVNSVKIKEGRIREFITINIARIIKIEKSKEEYDKEVNLNKFNERNQSDEPVVIQISRERNALERCMLHFSSYEKKTEYDEKEDKYISYIYYNKMDETELLIRILSFGPVIRVIGPDSFLEKVKKRVEIQKKLLCKQNL